MLIFVKTRSTSFYYFSFESYSIFDGENEQKISFFFYKNQSQEGYSTLSETKEFGHWVQEPILS